MRKAHVAGKRTTSVCFLEVFWQCMGYKYLDMGIGRKEKKKERITLGDRPSISQFDHNTVD